MPDIHPWWWSHIGQITKIDGFEKLEHKQQKHIWKSPEDMNIIDEDYSLLRC